MPGCFVNALHCFLVKVELLTCLQRSLSYIHLQPARGCALQIASRILLHPRKGELLTSHLNKVRGSLTICFPDYMNIPHLARIRTVSHALGQTNVSGIVIMCSQLHAGQCEAFSSVFKQAFPRHTCQLHVAVPCRLHLGYIGYYQAREREGF